MERIIFAVVVSLMLTACAMSRATRTRTSAPIKKWTGQLNEWRVLGEAYFCGEQTVRTAPQGFNK